MNFSLIDAGGLQLAILLEAATVALPGFALARAISSASRRRLMLCDGVLCGLALLPCLVSLATRLFGLDAAVVLDLGLAVCGVVGLRHGGIARPGKVALLLTACWLVIVLAEWIDYDTGTVLFQPLTAYDTVKHAATTQAIVESGAPPRDAFFLRPERSSYYYYFYTLAAVTARLSGGLVDARAAVGGLVFWTGLGTVALLRVALRRAGLPLATPSSRTPLLFVAVLALGGFDIAMVLRRWLATGEWLADPLSWNEQAGAWFEDVLWVPHHVTALMAGVLALGALCDAVGERGTGVPGIAASWKAVAVAGLGFAAMLGLSVWVALGFVATVAAWLVMLGPVERRWRALIPIFLAGVLALLFSLAQLHDLVGGRSGGPFPIALTVRAFPPLDDHLASGPWLLIARAAALPLNCGLEFGALALGSLAFWRARRHGAIAAGGEFGRVLAIAAVAGLVMATFLRSTLYNNDLGWRVMLLPLLAGTVWTIAVIDRWSADRHDAAAVGLMSPAFRVACGLGWLTVLYAAVMMRAYPFVSIDDDFRFMARDTQGQRALRVAFDWADRHLPASRVLQQSPAVDRSLAFGLYGRHPTGVSDEFGSLYGADPAMVRRRLAALQPIFTGGLTDAEVARRAVDNGIDDLVVTASDPVWADRTSFVWRQPPLFAAANVRIVAVGTLEAAR